MSRPPFKVSVKALPAQAAPTPGHGPYRLAAVALGILLTAATLILLAALWVMVGRPVEDLTGALIDGLAADALAFCLIAAATGAVGAGIARLAARF